MLIEKYVPEMFTPPCGPSPARQAIRARLTADLAAVLPYLNATLRGASYYPGAQALIWKTGGHRVAFHAHEVAVSDLEDQTTAEAELAAAVDVVNRTWERRAEITPNTTTRQRPAPLAVFKRLPQTNCKQCGEQTCFILAGKLVVGQRRLTDCPPLAEAPYADQRAALYDMLEEWT